MMRNRFALMLLAGLLAGLLSAGQAGAPGQAAPAAQEATDVQKQPRPKSQKEAEAVMAIFNAQDPDARIKAIDELVTKFADSEFKALALQVGAATYQQKNDFENMVIYAERTLEADPKNYAAMLMLASGIAQRTREHDLDREEKLSQAEKYARTAIELVKTSLRPRPDVTQEQWDAAKKDFYAQAHEALGLAAMARKKYDVAIKEFNEAIQVGSTPDPATMVRLGAVYNLAGKHDEAIAVLDKVLSAPDMHPTIKQFAQAEKVRAVQAKGGGAKPAAASPAPAPAPAAPPPAEPKQP